MVSTLLFTLYNNLLFGLIAGIIITLITHILIARISVPQFFLYVFSPGNIEFKKNNDNLELGIRGVANFMTLLKILKKLEDVPAKSVLRINFSGAKIIDLTVQEAIDDFKRNHELSGGSVEIVGLHKHVSSTTHKFALKSSIAPVAQKASRVKISSSGLQLSINGHILWDRTMALKTLKVFIFSTLDQLSIKKTSSKEPTLTEHQIGN